MLRTTKRIMAACLALILLLAGSALGEAYSVSEANAENFGRLLLDLLYLYEKPASNQARDVNAALAAIGEVNAEEGDLAWAIVTHWNRVYEDTGYKMWLYQGEQVAEALLDTDIQDGPEHAFVVLGYELKDGQMTKELIGRCDAAAAAAKAFPGALIVCSGGATGKNNPEGHTEAGMMKAYLTQKRGIDAARIVIDEQAQTTMDNAVNTFEMLRERNVKTMTLVTSSYHQKWAQVLYNALSVIFRQRDGYSVQIVENYSFPIKPEERYEKDDRFAIRQLGAILGLPETVRDKLRAF